MYEDLFEQYIIKLIEIALAIFAKIYNKEK